MNAHPPMDDTAGDRPPGFEERPRRTMGLLKSMFELFASAAGPLSATLPLVLIASGMAPVALSWVTRTFIDEVAVAGPDRSVLIRAALLIGGISTLGAVLMPASNYLVTEIQRRLGLQIDVRIANKLNSLQGIRAYEDPVFYDRVQVAHQAGTEAGPQIVITSSFLVQALATVVGFVAAIVAVSPRLLVVIALGVAPSLFIEPALARRRVRATIEMSPLERRKMFFYRLMLMPQAAREIRAYGLGEFFAERMTAEYRALNSIDREQSRRELFGQSFSMLVTGAAYVGALVLLVGQAVNATVGPGDVALVLAAVAGVQQASSGIVAGIADFDGATLLFQRFESAMAIGDDLAGPDDFGAATEGPHVLRDQIDFENVWFRYAEDQPWVLKGVSFSIRSGEIVGVVGENGAGKSTIIKLLLRLYDPDVGRILWDGVDIRRFDIARYRRGLAPVLQDHMEYDLTAHENIALGDIDRLDDRAAVTRAAEFAGIEERIARLPKGYDTLLSRMFGGEGSVADLSGGEWQRLSIARGAFRFPALLTVLDEPTAFLDPAAEESLFANLDEVIAGNTALLVSHRFTSLRTADCVHVIADGVVAESGSHHQLMDRDGPYARLYNLQLNRLIRDEPEVTNGSVAGGPRPVPMGFPPDVPPEVVPHMLGVGAQLP